MSSPTTYTPEAASSILNAMREGKSLRTSCQEAGVNKSTFLLWVSKDGELADQYARAREEMLDVHAEELEDIGEDAANADSAVRVAGLRLKADNRKWLLSRLAPKKYGDKIAVGGADDLPPVQVARIELVALSDDS
jgi:hypothetical protein